MEIPSRGGVPNGGVGFPSIGTFRTTTTEGRGWPASGRTAESTANGKHTDHTESSKGWKLCSDEF